ncbi:hypothetical protein FIBSPDRAFT_964743 [Athelia psychrophila]|uniref:Uncharacterized protein n=1 Tax=Athelia psychrophila TaxID=1759441 RepID=A0A165XFG0_9AGAM|nr:hypothetical protein FIBSPDRAFT_964743 [Fibularhizoctonia sp. CBS 109695]
MLRTPTTLSTTTSQLQLRAPRAPTNPSRAPEVTPAAYTYAQTHSARSRRRCTSLANECRPFVSLLRGGEFGAGTGAHRTRPARMCGGDSASTHVRRTRCSPPCRRTAAASGARFQLHPESHRPRIPQQCARTLTQCHAPLRVSKHRRLQASSLKLVCAARARVPSHRPRAPAGSPCSLVVATGAACMAARHVAPSPPSPSHRPRAPAGSPYSLVVAAGAACMAARHVAPSPPSPSHRPRAPAGSPYSLVVAAGAACMAARQVAPSPRPCPLRRSTDPSRTPTPSSSPRGRSARCPVKSPTRPLPRHRVRIYWRG